MNKHRPKCTRRKFCTRLTEKLNIEANHGKGLTMLVLTNMRTCKNIRLGVVYKTNERDRGLMVTFCPWCGTNLLELFHLAGSIKPAGPKVDPEHAP
jgi:hypothetical protein